MANESSGALRGKIVALLLIGGLMGVGVWALNRPKEISPLDTVPENSFLVGRLDLDDLRASPVFAAVSVAFSSLDSSNFFGYADLNESCGFDPITKMSEIVFAVPEEQEKGEFGIASRVKVTREELATCTANLAKKRSAPTETTTQGSFVLLGEPKGNNARIAFHAPNTLVVARGSWLDQMISAADGKTPRVAANADHARIRNALTEATDWKAPTLLASVLLPKSIRERIKSEMGGEVSGPNAKNVMNGVLGVRGAGLAIKIGQKGGRSEAKMELLCDAPEPCDQTASFLERQRFQLSTNLGVRLIGIGPLIDSFKVERKGDHVTAQMSISADELAHSIERAINFSKTAGQLQGLLPSPNHPSPFPAPPEPLPAPSASPAPPAHDGGN